MFSNTNNKKNNETGEKNNGKEKPAKSGAEKKVTGADEIALAKKELEEAEKKAEEYLNNWKRSQADFINYKRRQSELFIDMINASNLEMIMEILPIYEAFSLAVNQIPNDLNDSEWVKGVIQIKIQLENLLKKKGVEEIKTVGEKFNPEIHEAVEMVSSSSKGEGEILEEVQKGYKLNGKVIRAAKVKVGRK